ncbi:unnamed protein product [Prorocentrum cordatum]|uniref:Uncharacterized protein n=1 Tax=Prorocentrum cordatum TaxID=2364126 RepID=A0ABN9WF86_9DINO|nr:unnamed protein product [Polarella glacialis]
MQGITAYDSEEEEEEQKTEPKPAPVGAQATAKGPAPKPKASAPPSSAASAKKAHVATAKLNHLRKEILAAKSATATVQVVRAAIDTSWDSRWAAQALYYVAKRSTARTRKEWAADKAVLRLAAKLQEEAAGYGVASRRDEDVDTLLLSLEGLRRMGMQEPEAQKDVLGRVFSLLDADSWRHPVKSLARLYWLGASVKLEGRKELPQELRRRYAELSGPDAALIIAAMQHEGGRDAALLQKVLARHRTVWGVSGDAGPQVVLRGRLRWLRAQG